MDFNLKTILDSIQTKESFVKKVKSSKIKNDRKLKIKMTHL